MPDYQEEKFIHLLQTADEKAIHELIKIMRREADRIGLDLQESLQRLGIE